MPHHAASGGAAEPGGSGVWGMGTQALSAADMRNAIVPIWFKIGHPRKVSP